MYLDKEVGAMTLALIILIALIAILLLGAGFLGKELLKKFKIIENHVVSSSSAVFFSHPGAKAANLKWGMYDMVVTPDLLSTWWGATVYVEDPMGKGSGMDPFAYIPFETGTKRIRLWLGRTPVRLWFVPDSGARVLQLQVRLDRDFKDPNPDVVAKPHWWQRLGAFG